MRSHMNREDAKETLPCWSSGSSYVEGSNKCDLPSLSPLLALPLLLSNYIYFVKLF